MWKKNLLHSLTFNNCPHLSTSNGVSLFSLKFFLFVQQYQNQISDSLSSLLSSMRFESQCVRLIVLIRRQNWAKRRSRKRLMGFCLFSIFRLKFPKTYSHAVKHNHTLIKVTNPKIVNDSRGSSMNGLRIIKFT